MSKHPQSSSARHPIALACLALVAAVAMSACSRPAPVAAPEAVRPAYVVSVRDASASALPFVGEVRAAQRAELSFAVAGAVASVTAEVGDAVRRGQTLAVLDTRPLQAQLSAATADVQRAEAQLHEIRERQARIERAQQADAVSAAETGAVQLERQSAEAALRSAQAQRDHAAWSLANAELRAPIDGVVAQRTIERGQAAAPGLPVLVIDGAGRELVITVPGDLATSPGQAVTLRGNGVELGSQVLRVGGRLEAGGIRKVWLSVPAQAPVGSTWTASVQAKALPSGVASRTAAASTPAAAPTVQVPLRAVLPGTVDNTGSALRLAADGTTLESVSLQLGPVHGEWIDVSSGLKAGDRVVVAGALSLRPGQKVQPVDAKR